MKPIRHLLVLALGATIALFTGCTTTQYNYRATATQISEPPLNTVCTAQVGDEMLKQGKFTERDAFRLDAEKNIGMFSAYTLHPGYYVKIGEDGGSEFYMPADGPEGGNVTKGVLIDPWKSIRLSKDNSRLSIVTVFNLSVNASAEGVRRTKWMALTDDSFQQTLIYSGRVGNKINIGYREFSNNHARPAFNNDVEYDLNESSTIGYKGAEIEVIEATNKYIKYRVIRNFNAALR